MAEAVSSLSVGEDTRTEEVGPQEGLLGGAEDKPDNTDR